MNLRKGVWGVAAPFAGYAALYWHHVIGAAMPFAAQFSYFVGSCDEFGWPYSLAISPIAPVPLLYWHAYYSCDFPQWQWNDKGDWGEFEMWEEDLGWNDDDKVGKWWRVPTNKAKILGYKELFNCRTCSYVETGAGWPANGDVKFKYRVVRNP